MGRLAERRENIGGNGVVSTMRIGCQIGAAEGRNFLMRARDAENTKSRVEPRYDEQLCVRLSTEFLFLR
jgi:hypothetical protein